MLEERGRRSRAADPFPSHVLLLKNVLCVVLSVGVLWALVHSGYELSACLHALRVYSALVVVLEGVFRYYAAAPAALPDTAGAGKTKIKRHSKVNHCHYVKCYRLGWVSYYRYKSQGGDWWWAKAPPLPPSVTCWVVMLPVDPPNIFLKTLTML